MWQHFPKNEDASGRCTPPYNGYIEMGGCTVHLLGKAILHEVPVEVTDPLDVYGHHASTDGELGVVPPGRPHHVAQLEDVAHPGLRL